MDAGGYYFTNSQSVADLASGGPSYWFDGTSNFITYDGLTFNTGDFSIIGIYNAASLGASHGLIGGGAGALGLYVNPDDKWYVTKAGISVVTQSDSEIIAGVNSVIAYTRDYSTTTGTYYQNGNEDGIVTDNVDYDETSLVGVRQSSSHYWDGSISSIKLFNLALSAAEVKALSSGAEVPYKYVGASQTEQIETQVNRDFSGASEWNNVDCATYDETGDLTITWNGSGQHARVLTEPSWELGKTYRITFTSSSYTGSIGVRTPAIGQVIGVIVSGSNSFTFTVTGADTGIDVYALDASGGITLDNFSVTQIGCVLDLNPGGITTTEWVDASGNGLNGTVSGAVATNMSSLHGPIAFPATAVPSSDPNTLDDYEEGTWTMGVSFGGGTTGITYNASYADGLYTKIGNVVTITGFLVMTSKGSDTGAALFTGLPFTVVNNNSGYTPPSFYTHKLTFADRLHGRTAINNTIIYLVETTAAAGTNSDIDNTNFSNDTQIAIGLVYLTSE
jgi:hypothetical protein